jgi:hypothetical protein
MTQPQTETTPLVTKLLVLSDGSVLANNLTPAMAAALARIDLHPSATTQRSLTRGGEVAVEPEYRHGTNAWVRIDASVDASTQSHEGGAP